MEVRPEQLLVLAMIILATLFDLVMRWRRKPGEPTEMRGDETEVRESADLPRSTTPAIPAPAAATVRRPNARRVGPQRPPAATAVPPRRGRSRRGLVRPDEVRRGIVMMEILAPCRALRRQGEEGLPHG